MLALEILLVLTENPTDDSIELAVGFLKECGQRLTDVSPKGINGLLNLKHMLSVISALLLLFYFLYLMNNECWLMTGKMQVTKLSLADK